jgi:hypothetical protein
MAEFVVCKHPKVAGTAVLARTALRFMPGWEPVTPADTTPAGEQQLPAPGAVEFDPAAHSVADVNAHLAEHPEQVPQVLALEQAGKARQGVLAGPHAGAH